MNRVQKEQFVEEMKTSLNEAAGALFLDYTGLTVNDTNVVRKKFREAGVTYVVVKNTLMARAMEGSTFADAATYLKGTPTGIVIGGEDPVAAAKTTFDIVEEFSHMKVKGGILDSKAINLVEVEALSKMPSKTEIQAGIVGLAMSPASNLIGQFKGPAGKILSQIEKMIEGQEAA
jgi:large subunit ribosomal protein L10